MFKIKNRKFLKYAKLSALIYITIFTLLLVVPIVFSDRANNIPDNASVEEALSIQRKDLSRAERLDINEFKSKLEDGNITNIYIESSNRVSGIDVDLGRIYLVENITPSIANNELNKYGNLVDNSGSNFFEFLSPLGALLPIFVILLPIAIILFIIKAFIG